MVEPSNENTYVFTKEAVLRSVQTLEQCQIHEHFAGYLAILRAMKKDEGTPVRSADITEFHDRYLRVVGAPDKTPYVRPFKSRGHGLEAFNANVAGSYAPSSLRSGGKMIHVIEVQGEGRGATYGLHPDHAQAARDRLLRQKVPVGAMTAFLYRDYGFCLGEQVVEQVVMLFREEFGLADSAPDERAVFEMLFEDDLAAFGQTDLELLETGAT